MIMAQFSRTWWGKRFIEALEKFTDSGRLKRGSAYARNGKIKEHQIQDGNVSAKVRGSINAYFGVTKEPTYTTTIEIQKISAADWSKLVVLLGSKASLISKLLLGEIPDNIEEVFNQLNLHLLPHQRQDFTTKCSCPDYGNPCKHIAGVYYLVAAKLDQDPFLLFELRGISRSKLQEELAKSPLGKALSASLTNRDIPIDRRDSYYTRPRKTAIDLPTNSKDFWQGKKRLPQTIDLGETTTIPAVVVKKGGDFPAFWTQNNSFLDVMEELYDRVRKQNTR
jgi:uncharacterized Zn finger protein